jgi:uncharacterized membrane protein
MSRGLLRRISRLSLLVLASIVLAWPALSLDRGGIWLGLFLAAPLLLPAWGIAADNRRGLQSGILLQSIYLLIGLTEIIANPAARHWALALLLASLATCACLLTLLRLPAD